MADVKDVNVNENVNNNYQSSIVKKNGNFTYLNLSDSILHPEPKYDHPQKLDGIQTNPNEMKTINFKQDYVVFIRKKLYYAATAQDKVGSDGKVIPGSGIENYVRVYLIDNFTSIHTSNSTYSRSGSCSISLKGGERVTCAEKPESDQTTAYWSDWQTMVDSWLSIDGNFMNSKGQSVMTNWAMNDNGNVNFDNLLNSKQSDYGWKYAEKCDWEPMDEIWVFGKSRTERYGKERNYEFKFLPIFFGYLDSVQKTYQSGKNGLFISISASDHLKLLGLGKVVNYPTARPGEDSGGGLDIRYPVDNLGCFIINEPWVNMAGEQDPAKKDPNMTVYNVYDNVFSGKYPYEIIRKLAVDSGIPQKYIVDRIEEIKQVPFVYKIKGKSGDLFQADLRDRLQICQQAADKLFLEFFADEEGNLVLKIPSYALGANRKPKNNMGYPFSQELLDSIGPQVVEEEVDVPVTTTPTPVPTTTTVTTTVNILTLSNMKLGSSGDDVKVLQSFLQTLGYDIGSSGVDGKFGANTQIAVKAFQSEYGIGVDGIVGPETKAKMNSVITNACQGLPTLSSGSKGNSVKRLQRLLTASGYSANSIDGVFGPNTKSAVMSFQKSNSCSVDGIAGPQTFGVVNSKISSKLKGILTITKTVTTYSSTPSTGGTQVNPPVTPAPATSGRTEYIVKKGDCLWNIAKSFFGDGAKWPQIYNLPENKAVIGKNPNLIYPGQKLIIYKDVPVSTVTNNQVQQATQTVKQKQKHVIPGASLSSKTDQLIREVLPEYIISFTLIDTDKEIYNMYEIQMESNIVDFNQSVSEIRRAVPDLDSIVRFGLRPAPAVVNTPLINSRTSAEIWGIMMIARSLSNRYSGSLSMIEDSAIHVGDPIRLFMYDEHPYKETGIFSNYHGQSVFYVTAIDRSISPTSASTMNLTLRAGRMMGQESIYDLSLPMYKSYYDEKYIVDWDTSLDPVKNFYDVDGNYEPYPVQAQDTLQKIIDKKYDAYLSSLPPNKYAEIVMAIVALNPLVFGNGTVASYQQIDNSLYEGLTIKIPKPDKIGSRK